MDNWRAGGVWAFFGRLFKSPISPAAPYIKPDYKPYPKNVPGPVYVADGCCLSCGVWDVDAPEHFSWDDYPEGGGHCYVSKQPETVIEFAKIIEAMSCQELDCIRVKGCSDKWREMIVEKGQEEFLDDCGY